MAKNQIHKILAAPDKGITRTSGANGVLARLFRQMLMDLNVTHARWGSLMYDFITDVRNGVPNNRKDQTSMRGNLTKEFARGQMTWKVFCKAMRFLQIVKIDVVINAYHEDGQVTPHMTTVEFGSRKQNNLNQFLNEVDAPDSQTDRDDDDTSMDHVNLESDADRQLPLL